MSAQEVNALVKLLQDVPAEALKQTVDNVMIDYAISSIRDQQNQSPEEAVLNLINLKRLRDSLPSNGNHA